MILRGRDNVKQALSCSQSTRRGRFLSVWFSRAPKRQGEAPAVWCQVTEGRPMTPFRVDARSDYRAVLAQGWLCGLERFWLALR